MAKQFCLSLSIMLSCFTAFAGNKIKIYFNHPVDNTVSTGVNAVYLNSCLADTLVAYINRAKYTIDVAQYDFTTGTYANVAGAINSATMRGVVVRWIYDGSSSNSAMAALYPTIKTLGSPTSGSYGIMHNKFVIIDNNSADPNDALVWTGSADWSAEQFNTDYNNIVIIQDSALAHAYTAEFNMMWGGTGAAPDLSLSKFGPHKTDLGAHNFTIEGNHVELYFSPSDGTNTQIQNAISTANTDLYFGMYAFTDNSDASAIVSKYTSGVYVAGIDDNFSNSYTPYTTFTAGLGSHFFSYSGTGIYHNKFMIVDPSNKCSDPLVLTGSHNWSTSANTQNDENTLVIHNDTAANIYYQSFKANFTALGGTLAAVPGCALDAALIDKAENIVSIFPNPTSGDISMNYELASAQNVSITIFNILGQKIASLAGDAMQAAGKHTTEYTIDQNGLYIAQFNIGNEYYTKRILVQK